MVGSAISTGSQNMATMLAGRGVARIGAAGLLAVRFWICTVCTAFVEPQRRS